MSLSFLTYMSQLFQATPGRMAYTYGTADKIMRRVGATLSVAGCAFFETVITGGSATSALRQKICIGVRRLAGSASGAYVPATTQRTGISAAPRLHPRSVGLKTRPNNRHHPRGGLWPASFMPKLSRSVPSASAPCRMQRALPADTLPAPGVSREPALHLGRATLRPTCDARSAAHPSRSLAHSMCRLISQYSKPCPNSKPMSIVSQAVCHFPLRSRGHPRVAMTNRHAAGSRNFGLPSLPAAVPCAVGNHCPALSILTPRHQSEMRLAALNYSCAVPFRTWRRKFRSLLAHLLHTCRSSLCKGELCAAP